MACDNVLLIAVFSLYFVPSGRTNNILRLVFYFKLLSPNFCLPHSCYVLGCSRPSACVGASIWYRIHSVNLSVNCIFYTVLNTTIKYTIDIQHNGMARIKESLCYLTSLFYLLLSSRLYPSSFFSIVSQTPSIHVPPSGRKIAFHARTQQQTKVTVSYT